MKIFNAQQIKEVDQYTVTHLPILSIDLMEKAALAFCQWYTQLFSPCFPVYIYCGKGNNGGDGLAVARILLNKGYQVTISLVDYTSVVSSDYAINYARLQTVSPIELITNETSLVKPPEKSIIIDALLGTGLNRKIEGILADVVEYLNELPNKRISIDIPSGLYCDQSNSSDDIIFKADHVVTFELPKLSFMFPQNETFCNEWHSISIGLHPTILKSLPSSYRYVSEDEIFKIKEKQKKSRFSHKGTFGHALIIAGSLGKMGAATLTVGACMRSGAGLTTAYVPKCGYEIMQINRPEAMALLDTAETEISAIPPLTPYAAIAVGPGLGISLHTQHALHELLIQINVPLVIDADALTILANNTQLQTLLPPFTVLTPHPKEFERLAGKSTNDFVRLNKAIDFAKKLSIVLVLKGANTAIISPSGEVFFNSTGNKGMATGGSGDVLTGIITGLLCQGYSPLDAAIVGVYTHGKTGDQVAKKRSHESMIASDLVHELGAFHQ